MTPPFLTHSICARCWSIENPTRIAFRILAESEYNAARYDVVGVFNGPAEYCCKCGAPTRSGIFIRGTLADYPHCDGHVPDRRI